MNRKYIPYLLTMLFIGLITGNAFGQKKQQLQKKVTIESVVTDENGNPIPHVLVSGKEGAVEVTSDANGKFSIEIPENSKLLFEAKGYDQLILPATPAPAKVMLKKIEFLMDASSTVNIAFGKIKKREVALANSPYLIRPGQRKGGDTQISGQIVNQRIKKISNLYNSDSDSPNERNLSRLNPKNIFYSGLFHTLQKLEEQKGELTGDDYENVMKQYGISNIIWYNIRNKYKTFKEMV
jgi:hypothetical protein